MARKRRIYLVCFFLFASAGMLLTAQTADDDSIGFGDIRLGAPVGALPIPCVQSPVCEGSYEAAWVRIHHPNGLVQRIDVVYSMGPDASVNPIRFSPITLPQAIRAHSIRYGGWAPRLGFAGTDAGVRIIVDVANGIAYLADGATVDSSAREVRYLAMSDPLVRAASASLLSNHGDWLIQAARSTPRYKNLLATPGRDGYGEEDDRLRQEQIMARLEGMSSEAKSFAEITLMLSAHVSAALHNHQEPDPAVAENLRKAFALLTAREDEANSLIKDHGSDPGSEVKPGNGPSWPLDLVAEAESKMKELVSEGFVE